MRRAGGWGSSLGHGCNSLDTALTAAVQWGSAGPWLDVSEEGTSRSGLGVKRVVCTSSTLTSQQGAGEVLAAVQRVVCQEG